LTGSGTVISEADGKRALYDAATGAQIIPPKYERIGLRFKDGLIPVRSDGKWGFADLTGKLVVPATSDHWPTYQQGIAWMADGATTCPIDRRGERIPHIPCRNTDPSLHFVIWHVCRTGQ